MYLPKTMKIINGEFYFVSFVLFVLMLATIVFQGFTRSGITLVIMLCMLLWVSYKRLFGIEPIRQMSNIAIG